MVLSSWIGRTTLTRNSKNRETDRRSVPLDQPHLVVRLQQSLVVSDVLHLVQEPAVDLGELVQLVHCVAGSERRRQNEDALICRSLQLLVSRGDKR